MHTLSNVSTCLSQLVTFSVHQMAASCTFKRFLSGHLLRDVLQTKGAATMVLACTHTCTHTREYVVRAISCGQITLVHVYSQLDSRATRKWLASDTRVPFNLLVDWSAARIFDHSTCNPYIYFHLYYDQCTAWQQCHFNCQCRKLLNPHWPDL